MLELSLETQVDLARSGARHGLGLFETIRIRAGVAPWLELHLERLASGCAFLGLEPPPSAERVRDFVGTNQAPASLGEGILRLIAVDGALRVFVEPLGPASPRAAGLGRSQETVRFSGNPLNRFKTLSYLENLCLTREAARRGLFEVIALNEKGHLSDGGRTTLFVVIEGRTLTPPVADGALPGIARRLLLESGQVSEATLDWSDLERAEGVFLGNALRGVIPVDRIEGVGVLGETHPAISRAAEVLARPWS